MKRCLRLSLFLLIFFQTGFAQLDSLYRQREITVKNAKDSLSPFKKNFFQQFGGTIFLDFGAGNPTGNYTKLIDYNTGRTYDSLPQTNEYITLGELTYEPRYNLVNYSDFFSVSFSMPTSLMLSIYLQHEGLLGLRTIPMVDLNFYNHATFNNLNKYGFHVGGGFALNASPMKYFETRAPYNNKNTWTSPVVRAGLKFPFRGKNCFLNCTYGFPSEHRKIGKLTYSKGWMFVLTAGILINYD